MYIVERLKQDYPEHTETLDTYDKFLHRYYSDDLIRKIYDDEKEHFCWVEKAFKCGPGTPGYNKNMARYSSAINFDIDFLRSLVKNPGDKTVEELRKELLGEFYSPDYENKMMNKLKEHND